MPTCSQCGGTDIEIDASRGDAVCIQCGNVLEENTIVNEVTFAQDAGGGSSVVGQFVSATPGMRSAGLGFARESREVAFSNGQRHISQLAAALRLAEHHQEAAQRLFMLAVQHNFIQGRKTQHVIAACLYTVCRREKTAHLLIDYSDVLQTNVYMLGSCFLKFTRMLSLTLPIIDPSLYIHRFASKLEFGDRTHLVSMSALRLVQRMKRDWIQTGRRPSGICGAALLIAARLHGFRRTQREVVRVVRICDVTLRKRLEEFSDTSLGALTAQQLETIDLQNFGVAADPPSFLRNRETEEKERRMLLAPARETERQRRLEEARALKVIELRERLAERGQPTVGKKSELRNRLLECLAEEDAAEDELNPIPEEPIGLLPPPQDSGEAVDEEMRQALQNEEMRSACGADPSLLSGHIDGGGSDASRRAAGEGDAADEHPLEEDPTAAGESRSRWTVVDLFASRDEEEIGEEQQQALMDELNDDLEAFDDEVDGYLIKNSEELARKEKLWDDMNKEYLEQRAARLEARERAEAADGGGSEDAMRARTKKRQRRQDGKGQAGTAAEAVEGELRSRQLSNRLNYDVVHLIQHMLPEDAPLMPDGMEEFGSTRARAVPPGALAPP